MNKLDTERILDIETRVQSGLRKYALSGESKARSVELADQLIAIGNEVERSGLLEVDQVEFVGQTFSNVDHATLRRLRKVTELIEEDMRIDVGHSKLARAAGTAANLSSIGAFLLAGHGLLTSAEALVVARQKAGSIGRIKNTRFFDFYVSICVFIAEGFLLSSPVNYRFAWRGTRHLNNLYLYRLREYNSKLYRLILSEIHYAIRGILPSALQHPEEYVAYLATVTVKTVKLMKQFSDDGLDDLRKQIEEIIAEFRAFVEQTYEVAAPDVNLNKLVIDISTQLSGEVDIPTFPVDWDLSTY